MKEIRNFKSILTNILNGIVEFCESNDIRYSLAYGTLIGAVRHKGFIPWDDDIDIMMPRPDYELFRKNFSHPIFKLVEPRNSRDYIYPFVKVYDSRTIIKEQSDLDTPFGLYVDIFPIDGLPANALIRKFYIFYFHMMKEIISVPNMSSQKSRGLVKQIIVKSLKLIFKPLPINLIAKWMDKSILFYHYSKSKFVGNLMWESYKIKGFNKGLFESYTNLEFENLNVKVITEYDNWLKTIYGDYMQLPPEEKRISRHSFTAYMVENLK